MRIFTFRNGRAAALAALLAAAPAAAIELQVGDAEERVYAELGEPEGRMQVMGRTLLTYRGGAIELERGRVVHIDPDFEDRTQRRAEEERLAAEQAALAKAESAGVMSRLRDAGRWASSTWQSAFGSAEPPAPAEAPGVDEPPPPEPVRVFSNRGEPVELEALLEPGHVTVVDFYADWCGPCKAISPHLEQLARKDRHVVLRKVDIVRWDTPVAQQYQLRSIPHVRVFDPAGRQVGPPTSDLRQVMQMVARAK